MIALAAGGFVIKDAAGFLVAVVLLALMVGAVMSLIGGRGTAMVACLLTVIVILLIVHFMEIFP